MAAALDIIVLLIIVFTVWRAVAKGLIRTVFDMLKFAASVVCAFIFKDYVAKLIMKTGVYVKASGNLTDKLSGAISKAGENIGSGEMLEAFENGNPELVKIIEAMGANLDSTQHAVEEAARAGADNLADIAANSIIAPAMEITAHIIAFVLIFVAAFLILWITERILDALFGLPGLNGLNRFGGFIIGVIAACLYVSLFTALTSPIISNPGIIGGTWNPDIADKTYIYSYFQTNNIFSIFR